MLDTAQAPGVTQDDSETLSENVFRRIQAAIVKGEIAPGSKISEPELADRKSTRLNSSHLKLSRMPSSA